MLCDYVMVFLKGDWLLWRGIVIEEGVFFRGLREGWGGMKWGWV